MDIEKKVKLSQTPIVFFAEGSFLKIYNHSFYVVTELLNFKLKPIIKYVKKVDQVVIYGGFPCNVMDNRYPDSKATNFGYQLIDDYDLSGYNNWYQKCCQSAINDSNKIQSPHVIQQIADPLANHQQGKNSTNRKVVYKSLTQQHLLFLSSWRQNKYPHAVDSAFIQDLKNYFKV